MADGSIVFNTKIDNTDVPKELKKVERAIEKSVETIAKITNKKMPLEAKTRDVGAQLDEAKAKAEALRKEMEAINTVMSSAKDPVSFTEASARKDSVAADLKAAEKEAAALQKQFDRINDKVDNYDHQIRMATEALERNKAKAAELTAQMNSNGAKMSAAFAKAETSAKKFTKRLWELGKSALIFNVISAGLRSAQQYMGKMLKTNSEYTAQLARLKAALLTAFQPIYEFALPGLLAVLRVLTSIVTIAANVLSFLTGKTLQQSAENAEALNEEADAIGGVGAAAKEAKKDLAAFDEINMLGSPDVSNGGGGGSSGTITPDFDGLEDMTGPLQKLLGIVTAIGAGLLTWSIAKSFTDSLSLAAGLALAVGGVFLYAFNWADAFSNGIDWSNLNMMLAGMLAIIGGLGLAFGPVGAAIGALITGVGMIIVALNDFRKTGELSNETLMALAAGILAIGGGIALLTGSWIPLVIAGVISLVTVLSTEFNWIKDFVIEPLAKTLLNLWEAVTDGAWDMFNALKMVFEGIAQFIGGILKGSIMDAVNGIIDILNGFISAFYAAINFVIRAINSISVKVPDWVPEIGGETWGPNIELLTPPQIPKLAQGAVLPANKPFLAVVGDQKNGTNVEAPLETIKQALAEVMAQYGSGDVNVNISGDLAPFIRWLKVEIDRENKRVGPSLANGNY